MAILNLVVAVSAIALVAFVMHVGHRAGAGHFERHVHGTERETSRVELDRAA